MQYKPEKWYEWLVAQSRTDHIYDLIHNYLPYEFEPNHAGNFVAVAPEGLHEKLLPQIAALKMEKISPAGEYPVPSVQLLPNNALTPFLEAATSCKEIEDEEGNNYILLLFSPLPDTPTDEEEQEVAGFDEEEDEVLRNCWELIVSGDKPETALQYAIIGESFLNNQLKETLAAGAELGELTRLKSGYNIIAVAYLWNNRLTDARRCDAHYLTEPHLWPSMETVIGSYLEMLMAKKQVGYLQELFQSSDFQEFFLPHYEAYMSLFVNDQFRCSRITEMVPIINRVHNGFKAYL